MSTPPDWLLRRDIIKAAKGAPFDEQLTVYAPPLEWSSDEETIHGARIHPVLLDGRHPGAAGWMMRLDYVDVPVRVYVHWLWRLGCDPPWLIYDAYPYGDMSTPHSSIEISGWPSMERRDDLGALRFINFPGLTQSVRMFDRITAAIARNIADGYDFEALRATLVGDGAS